MKSNALMAESGKEMKSLSNLYAGAQNNFEAVYGNKMSLLGGDVGSFKSMMQAEGELNAKGIASSNAMYNKINSGTKAAAGYNSENRALMQEEAQAASAAMNGLKAGAAKQAFDASNMAEGLLKSKIEGMQMEIGDEVKNWLQTESGEINGKSTELSSLQKVMQNGLAHINGDAKAADEHLDKLNNAAKNLNEEVHSKFTMFADALSTEKSMAFATEQNLTAELDNRAAAIASFESGMISKLNTEQQEQFQSAKALRDKAIQETLQAEGLSHEERLGKIRDAEAAFAGEMANLKEMAHLDESEIERIRQNQQSMSEAVATSVTDMQDYFLTTQEMLKYNSDELEEKSKAVRDALVQQIMVNCDSTDKVLQEKLAKSAAEADAMIARIMDGGCPDPAVDKKAHDACLEDKKTKVELMRTFMTQSLQEIVKSHVHAEAGLEAFENSEVEAAGETSGMMKELESTLSTEQMEFVRSNLEEQRMLREQQESLTGMVSNILGMLDQKGGSTEQMLATDAAAMRTRVQNMKLEVQRMASSRTSAADEAKAKSMLVMQNAVSSGK